MTTLTTRPVRERRPHDLGTCTATVAQKTPLLSVIIPAYDEELTIEEVIRKVTAAPYEKQIIVVDDGSSDETYRIARRWADCGMITLLKHAKNLGKGRAIRTALKHARGQFVLIQDADLECDPADYTSLVEPLCTGRVMAVFGSRFLERSGPRGTWWCRWGVLLLDVAVRILYGAHLRDQACCYKAMPTQLLRSLDLRCERFEFCAEVTAKLCRLGIHIHQVPVRYRPRTRAQGKKIRWKDGIVAMWSLWRWRRWPVLGVDGQVPLLGRELGCAMRNRVRSRGRREAAAQVEEVLGEKTAAE